jgi:hypothetical protein
MFQLPLGDPSIFEHQVSELANLKKSANEKV